MNNQSKLIISCQAPVNSPLHNPQVIGAMATAAIQGGAAGVRIDTPAHVKAVREILPNTLIIGLWKRQIEGYEVYITPRAEEAEAIALAGADIIAIDATSRKRPGGETVESIIAKIKQRGKKVMADVDSIENAIAATKAGADIVGTTLYGYTEETKQLTPPGYSLLQEMKEKLDIRVICEGGIATTKQAQKALKLGADAIVIGKAITGIDAKIQEFQAVFNL
ncbi:MAG: N-acetylmannosamine-6-phosphate 2-epimerase [Gomphosphaeria aponina SAG 52.96 = DSM 107014]|uniref:Putative N-acetylmannosamine-6-phosphate 2-epimerase n=1 Tax=Gomphosphaeria aponina SAG 52.96 = DSM 107014 TaxID=1521640 RepID=A0A941GRG4_9CHRO|nr:N-acetylmannosamine-6-phosphate 2-epimerase [Gomphosphaeria aponina SAG 52.96 = DSM 107014]